MTSTSHRLVVLGSLVALSACSADDGGTAPVDDARDASAQDARVERDSATSPDGAADVPCADDPTNAPAHSVLTDRGRVVGDVSDGVARYLGIPYAAPPVGDLRWRLPVSPACFDAPRDATSYGAECPQYTEDGTLTGDEDCLTLNVWAPEGASGRPVLVFIHGGGHEQGSGSKSIYDGSELVRREDVITVTLNYRLGPLGFLAHPALSAEGGETKSGNYGMHDQIAALAWVQRNIAQFGGDPQQVLIFGQSAGSVSVCRLIASPLAKGLFSAAALHSGGCVARALDDAEERGRALLSSLGCDDASDVPACLRDKSSSEVMGVFEPLENGTSSLARTFDGVIDGYALLDAPRDVILAKQHNAVPVIVGATTLEAGREPTAVNDQASFEAAVRAFIASAGIAGAATIADEAIALYPVSEYDGDYRKALLTLKSDVKFVCGARRDARALARSQPEPVYHYSFDKIPDLSGAKLTQAGAFHGIDLVYIFDTLRSLGIPPGADDRAVTAHMQHAWSSLASGALEADPAWPRYEIPTETSLVYGAPIRTATSVREAQCDFWDDPR